MLSLRQKAVEQARSAKKFGLILGTLGRQGNVAVLDVSTVVLYTDWGIQGPKTLQRLDQGSYFCIPIIFLQCEILLLFRIWRSNWKRQIKITSWCYYQKSTPVNFNCSRMWTGKCVHCFSGKQIELPMGPCTCCKYLQNASRWASITVTFMW